MTVFNRVNNITGWIVFVIAAVVYLFTIEPTVSLWDCGEFTSAAYKLEVGHPPGAPFYLMLARIFSLMAIDNAHVAVSINSLSAISSAFTVLFLFWIITHFARKIYKTTSSKADLIAIMGCGAVGALSFCFSDSFWFSAVEAEVYALSSLFTALVFWSILKWEEDSGPYANRWLVLIAYLIGLSIGVHLLNLLALPAIAMVYFFKKEKVHWAEVIIALIVSFLLLITILYVIIPGTVKTAVFLEIFTVNKFHIPINSGFLLFVLALSILLVLALIITYRQKNIFLNTAILCLTVMLIGYSSYAMIVIRAQANTPINTGNPDNAYKLLSYLNRDQYGERPLFYGQYYNAPGSIVASNSKSYLVVNGKYKEVSGKKAYSYDERFMTFFPRMYSSNSNHIQVYKDWGTIRGVPVKLSDENPKVLMKPTFGDNLEFFIKYQLGYMYFRYFMWNFAGKQNDIQGNGGILRGNWISGIDYIDQWFIGPQRFLPDYLKNNPGRNRYFLLPLLLGILGMVFHYSRRRRYFGVVFILFLLTGIGIVLYTNQTPLQPRERDYAYVGSFFAFSIWIGLGVLWLINVINQKLNLFKSAIFGVAGAMIIPILMFQQNIDDHNRSGRYVVRDIAANYLNSCDQNAILFTVGDNDTYPLWYLQEVEGIRPDVRVVNLMLLNADWYIDQMKEKKYLSEPLPISLKHEQYRSGNNSWTYISDNSSKPLVLKDAVQLISRQKDISSSNVIESLPIRKMALPVQKDHFNECFRKDFLLDTIFFSMPHSYIGKSELIVMDILAHNDWKRPVYYDTPGYKGTLGLDTFLFMSGFTYQLFPSNSLPVNTTALYNKFMKEFKWVSLENGKALIDDHIKNMLSIMKVRQNYSRLASLLAKEGKKKKSEEVLDRLMQIMPVERFPYDHYCVSIAEAYYQCGSIQKGDEIAQGYTNQLRQELDYFNKLSPLMKSWVKRENSNSLFYLEKLVYIQKAYHRIIQ